MKARLGLIQQSRSTGKHEDATDSAARTVTSGCSAACIARCDCCAGFLTIALSSLRYWSL